MNRVALSVVVVLLGLGWFPPSMAEANTTLKVVASIKPIHSLVSGVMEGVGVPTLIVKGVGSPHTYSLRPSDARALSSADVVFWVGPQMEIFLVKPLEALSGKAKVIALGSIKGLTLLPTRQGGMWEPDVDEPKPATVKDAGSKAPVEYDQHVWLDPINAQQMVRKIASVLSGLDPAHASTYEANRDKLIAKLARLNRDLRRELAPVAKVPFVVFHDGYHYFDHRYGLNAVGSITVEPDRPPGARRISEIRDKLASLSAACVFSEPEFKPRLVATVTEGTHARTGVLDPLGADLPDGPALYFTLIHRMASSLVQCLSKAQAQR